jgi:neutral ceramidase
LSVIRIDDDGGRPIAGWIRFAAHPANVIFNAPVSAEYPGYMTDRLSQLVDGSPPFLFGYGAAGNVNCIPMFGRECESRDLGHRLAERAAETFASIRTQPPRRMLSGSASVELPLDAPPTIETLDREIEEVESFLSGLERNPDLVWVLGYNCWHAFSVEKKRASVKPLGEWAKRTKGLLLAGYRLPSTWVRPVVAWIIDDLGLVFDPGESYMEIGLAVSAQSPLAETLLLTICNGLDLYLATDDARRRGGYEPALSTRYFDTFDGKARPLPYALGAADRYVDQVVRLLSNLNR